MELTEMQEAFIEEYLKNGGNAKAAALVAGYSLSVSKNAGREILGSASVKNAIDERLRELRDRALVKLASKLDEVLDALIEMALDEDTPATARQRALVEVLDRSGIIVRQGPDADWPKSQDNGLDEFLEATREDACESDAQGACKCD